MIHTVTFNPALDYIVRLEDLKLGEVNRVNYEQILPGGKGVNVSIVLGNLGHANRALGFSAGFTGIALEGMLEEFGVTCDFVKVAKGMTRINLKAKAKEARLKAEALDVTEPAAEVKIGVKHPITQIIEEVTEFFESMGYSVYEGPDADTVFNTFKCYLDQVIPVLGVVRT